MIYTYIDVCEFPGYENGKCKKNLLIVLRTLDPDGSDSFDNWAMYKVGLADLSDVGRCVCSHDIKYQFSAIHIKTGDIIELGSECINSFDPEYKKITQRAIDLFKNPNNRYCPMCDKKVPHKVVDKYIGEKVVYHDTCYKKCENRVKCKWCKYRPLTHEATEHFKIHIAKRYRITFGKYKNKVLSEIYKCDNSYIGWLSRSAYNPVLKEYTSLLLK